MIDIKQNTLKTHSDNVALHLSKLADYLNGQIATAVKRQRQLLKAERAATSKRLQKKVAASGMTFYTKQNKSRDRTYYYLCVYDFFRSKPEKGIHIVNNQTRLKNYPYYPDNVITRTAKEWEIPILLATRDVLAEYQKIMDAADKLKRNIRVCSNGVESFHANLSSVLASHPLALNLLD